MVARPTGFWHSFTERDDWIDSNRSSGRFVGLPIFRLYCLFDPRPSRNPRRRVLGSIEYIMEMYENAWIQPWKNMRKEQLTSLRALTT